MLPSYAASLILPLPKFDTLTGLPPLPERSATGSCRRFAATAEARSFLLNEARFSFDIHFGFASPGSLAQGPIASPLLLIRFQPPSGSVLLNHLRKSSLIIPLPKVSKLYAPESDIVFTSSSSVISSSSDLSRRSVRVTSSTVSPVTDTVTASFILAILF